VDRKTVAVLSFTNGSGDAQYDPLGKGIAAMMITDLSNIGSIQLVERERLNDLTSEMQLQHSGLVDPATAARVGKLVGAQYVVTGAITALDPRMRLDTRVIRVESGEIVKTAQVTGDQKKFFELQQKLSRELIKGLDVVLSPEDSARLEAAQQAERIDDLKITLQYSQALDLFDRKQYVDAATTMAQVVHSAPESTLARVTYKMMSDRAKQEARKKTTDKLKGWLHKKIDG
jgi:TolB-like protein